MVVKKSDLPPDLRAKLEIEQKVQTYGKYAGIGREIGVAVDGALSAITDNAQKFAQTDVGKLTIFLVVWKVIGGDFIQLAIGIFLFAIGVPIFIWLLRRNCIVRRIPVSGGKSDEKKYEVYTPDSNTQWAYGIAFFLYIIMAIIVIFA
jgi:hypothetical protein